jgi:WXG100 family type VII secretion target
MAMNKVRADFARLAQLARSFGQQAETIEQMRTGLQNRMNILENGDWLGKGATAFYGEMNGNLIPSLKRLTVAMRRAADATCQINRIMQQAEADVAALFRSNEPSEMRGQNQASPISASSMAFAGGAAAPPTTSPGQSTAPTPTPRIEISKEEGGDGIHPSDVDQNGHNDCFMMAALASLAQQNPDAIRRMIKDNGDGTFTVTFYDQKTPQEMAESMMRGDPNPYKQRLVTVDGVLSRLNAIPDEPGELWAPIIEKAYAKAYGIVTAYDEAGKSIYGFPTTGGTSGMALEHLTGKPSQYLPILDKLSIYDLASHHAEGYAITLGTYNLITMSPDEKLHPAYISNLYGERIGQFHAYYVSEVDVVNNIVTVHNPSKSPRIDLHIPFEEFKRIFNGAHINAIG